ncbi:MAG TPA: carboxypeptidase regulatory-like domain-containing protein [Rhodothermales bacterium]|nr:carboxypeptidase regulatory-like domain-containing protein [Rhodothermales bacterium]
MRTPFKTWSWWMSLVVLLATALTAEAQVTTASFTGKVTDPQGNPVPGATIIATHVPSGTVNGTTSNVNGNYNLLYLRTGGPYTLKVTFVGYKAFERTNLFLSLSEQKNVDITLTEENATVDVEITAERNAAIAADRTGAKQNISTAEIENLPTIARSITDFTKVSPQVVGNNVGGANNRYNNIQIDGAVTNDVFGLADNGLPGGQTGAQPIGLDAIAEFNVEVAPYDVRQSGFTGGLINAVSRSGTNNFNGSLFGYYRNNDFTGKLTKDAGGNPLSTASLVPEFTDYQTGFRVGGPIIENKLFFFLNGELRDRGDPIDAGLKDYNVTAPNIFNAAKADMDRIVTAAKNIYGFDAGSYDNFNAKTGSQYLFARIDYNINKTHRLMIRNNFVDADRLRGVDRNTSTFGFDTQAYKFLSKQNSTVVQLTSVLGAKIGNEARLVYTTIRDKRSPQINPFPQIEIQNVAGSGTSVFMGVERSSQQNALDQNLLSFTDNFSYFAGDHNITAGVQIDHSTFSNLFIQDAFGTWRFSSIANFENKIANRYRKSYLLDGGKERAEWAMLMSGAYLQDQWKALPNLRLTLGVRVDVPTFLDNPTKNNQFATDFPGRSTDEVPSGQVLFSPRFGFNYDVFHNKKTQLRGGIGVFSGKTPGVWLSNQYSNTGVDFARIDVTSGVPTVNVDPNYKPAASLVAATSAIALTDKGFKLPQVLRGNIGLDQELPLGLVGTLEFLYSKNMNDVVYENLNLVTDASNISTTTKPSDGRPFYVTARKYSRYTNVMLLKNSNEGYTYNFSVQLKKNERNGFFGNIAYTYGEAWDVNSGRSSVAQSQYEFNEVTGNPNDPGLARSDYDVPHRIIGTISYKFNLGKLLGVKTLATTASLLYEGRSGFTGNYVYVGDANGDGFAGNDLAFIPANETDAVWQNNGGTDTRTPAQVWADANSFIESVDDLKNNRGKIFPRNGARQPWRNSLDARFTIDLPSVKNQKLQLTADILNVLSLINEEWGVVKFINFDSYSLFGFRGYEASTGKPILRFTKPANGTPYTTDQIASRWQMQLGLRYTF